MSVPAQIRRSPSLFAVIPAIFTSMTFADVKEGATPALRVASYNIQHGKGMERKEVDLARQAAVIKAMNADVVVLQEVDKVCERSGKVDQAAEMARLAGYPHYFFAPAMDFQGGKYGLAVMSRRPFLATRAVSLDHGGEPRAAAIGTIEHDGRKIRVVSIHLDHLAAERREAQAADLLKQLGECPGATILAGDFNCAPDQARKLAPGFVRIAKQGSSQTAPADQPLVEIDHFLISPPDFAQGWISRVIDEPSASDHRPILLERSGPESP